MREVLHAHRLKPDPAWSRQRREEQALAAEQHVLDARHGHDAELHRLLEHPDVAWMDAKRVPGLEVVGDNLPAQLAPGLPLTLQPLQPEAGAAEDAGAEALLKADRELHAWGGAHDPVPVTQVALARRDLHREDLSRQLGGE